MASRYKRSTGDDGDDDDDGEAALMLASMGPPMLIMVFEIPQEDQVFDEGEIQRKKDERDNITARLRKLELNVEQVMNRGGDKLFLKISAPDAMLQRRAEQRGIRLQLDMDKYGGAMCAFSRKLYRVSQKTCFAPPADGCQPGVFSSLVQLDIADEVVRSEPWDDGTGMHEPINPEELMAQGVIVPNGYFLLHYDRARLKLIVDWAGSFSSPQPLEDIRAYFGEKYALLFTFFGFYTTMLWIPALCGTALFISQLVTRPLTGSWDTPFLLPFACVMSLWTVCLSQLWRRLEGARKFEWDTVDFEDQQSLELDFKRHPDTIKNTHINAITGEADDFYFDQGSYLPPSGRTARVMQTFAVILALNTLASFLYFQVWKSTRSMMSVGDTTFGAVICGVLWSVIGKCMDALFKRTNKALIYRENWATETEREDAEILRVFCFKIVNLYIGVAFVAFAANSTEKYLGEVRCPGWQCMPVVQGIFATLFVTQTLFRVVEVQVIPVVKRMYQDYMNNSNLKAAAKTKVVAKLPMEEQLELGPAEGVVEAYEGLVFQLGYISMFSCIFPLCAPLALAINLVDLRSSAYRLLMGYQRPSYQCAADIGSWQVVIGMFSTLAILSNTGLVCLCSHAVYFYKPDMTLVDRVWILTILEHALFIAKVIIENVISDQPDSAIAGYRKREDMKKMKLAENNLTEYQFKVE